MKVIILDFKAHFRPAYYVTGDVWINLCESVVIWRRNCYHVDFRVLDFCFEVTSPPPPPPPPCSLVEQVLSWIYSKGDYWHIRRQDILVLVSLVASISNHQQVENKCSLTCHVKRYSILTALFYKILGVVWWFETYVRYDLADVHRRVCYWTARFLCFLLMDIISFTLVLNVLQVNKLGNY